MKKFFVFFFKSFLIPFVYKPGEKNSLSSVYIILKCEKRKLYTYTIFFQQIRFRLSTLGYYMYVYRKKKHFPSIIPFYRHACSFVMFSVAHIWMDNYVFGLICVSMHEIVFSLKQFSEDAVSNLIVVCAFLTFSCVKFWVERGIFLFCRREFYCAI